MRRIVVIDDDPAITSVLKRGLAYEGYTVDVASSGEDGLALVRESVPDVMILDIMMPGIDGLEALRRLRAVDAQLPVLLLTAKDAPEDEVRGLQSGADDYVVKPFTFAVLLAHVQALLRRQQPDQVPVLRFADVTLDPSSHLVRRGEREIALTALEFKLLHAFLRHPHQVLSKEVLLERVWGYDFGGNSNVVEVYVKQLRQKLQGSGEPSLIHTMRNVGYVLREE
jgi:two-component system, OmpR family, response regulator MprA